MNSDKFVDNSNQNTVDTVSIQEQAWRQLSWSRKIGIYKNQWTLESYELADLDFQGQFRITGKQLLGNMEDNEDTIAYNGTYYDIVLLFTDYEGIISTEEVKLLIDFRLKVRQNLHVALVKPIGRRMTTEKWNSIQALIA